MRFGQLASTADHIRVIGVLIAHLLNPCSIYMNGFPRPFPASKHRICLSRLPIRVRDHVS